MPIRSNTCPKCQSAMAEGFTLADQDSYRRTTGWVAGPPQKKLLLGLKLPHKPIGIQTWRCPRCGFLEHYAKE
ncbi:PF20097 family protein [Sphingomonas sp. HITSZ_GF]|uniref:PF20097 family protein n=1 Tax=Sphingomonas sp. HITSZ_GF TaxID=3037247 RepID=UPI00240E5007|nr:PF20097 family protein [Sphingomonas sp. HITSZ_GF]MDG2534650.1 PF20097 family protein [Sphingomonas sp. HITSZ_GF]